MFSMRSGWNPWRSAARHCGDICHGMKATPVVHGLTFPGIRTRLQVLGEPASGIDVLPLHRVEHAKHLHSQFASDQTARNRSTFSVKRSPGAAPANFFMSPPGLGRHKSSRCQETCSASEKLHNRFEQQVSTGGRLHCQNDWSSYAARAKTVVCCCMASSSR